MPPGAGTTTEADDGAQAQEDSDGGLPALRLLGLVAMIAAHSILLSIREP